MDFRSKYRIGGHECSQNMLKVRRVDRRSSLFGEVCQTVRMEKLLWSPSDPCGTQGICEQIASRPFGRTDEVAERGLHRLQVWHDSLLHPVRCKRCWCLPKVCWPMGNGRPAHPVWE